MEQLRHWRIVRPGKYPQLTDVSAMQGHYCRSRSANLALQIVADRLQCGTDELEIDLDH
jgi:hypothetical protein